MCIRRAILAAGYGKKGIEMRWDGAWKMLIPLERASAEKLLKALPDKYSGKITVIHHVDTLPEETWKDKASDDSRLPCCNNCNGQKERNLLIPATLHLNKTLLL